MACASITGLHRSDSGGDRRCGLAGMRRSRSEPQLRRTLTVTRTSTLPSRLKTSRSVGMFPFPFSGNLLPNSIRSFLFDSEDVGRGMGLLDAEESNGKAVAAEVEVGADEGIGAEKQANWMEWILKLRSRWRNRQHKDDDDDDEEEDYICDVSYEESEAEDDDNRSEWDRESFSLFLNRVPLSETKILSELALLCNLAYVIPEIKVDELRRFHDLRWGTSSLERKAEAAAIRDKLENDSTRPSPRCAVVDPRSNTASENRTPMSRPSVAYEIAASAASYVNSRAKGLLSLGGGPGRATGICGERTEGGTADSGRVYNSEMAAYVATSTMTTVVAAEEEARLEAARDLRSLQSSPCEWFVCDRHSTCTRCFVIQGSDSLASWQANLFFEPTKFEGTKALVHRGIYEMAKGIYEQFIPEIQAHLRRYGERARLRFTGHSLGGSLSLLVSLMLVARRAVPQTAILPVVTFGSPSIFCGGRRVLDELGLDEAHVRSVMMHRDIVPRAFSCNYPNQIAQVLKRLNAAFRSHPCLNSEKLLYSPLGQLYILQPDEKSSPPHPLLPPGAALYALDRIGCGSALRAFLNSPHPLETLSDLKAYGSDGTILRDHDSSNYLKAVNGLLQQHTSVIRRSRRQRLPHWWPLLTPSGLEKEALATMEVVNTGV